MHTKYSIVIPAAGRGSRLKPLTNTVPKSLVQITKQSILDYQLNSLNPKYVKNLIIVLGYKGQKIINYIENMNLPYDVFFVENNNYTNSKCGTSLMKSIKIMEGPLIFFNSDLLFSSDIIEKLVTSQNKNIIVGNSIVSNFRPNKYHAKLRQTTVVDIEYSNLSYDFELIGPVKISSDVFHEINNKIVEKGIDLDTMSCFSLIKLVLANFHLEAYDSSDQLLHEIDNIDDLQKARSLLRVINE